MGLITNIMQLMLLLILYTTSQPVVASSFEFNYEGPIDDSKIKVIIHPRNNVQIECTRPEENIYLELENSTLGEMQQVQFSGCPLPPGGSSFNTILNRLGIRKTRTLNLSYVSMLGGTLVRQHFSGLSELERLVLSKNGLTDLPDDLFDDVANLTWLNLRSNKLQLPVNIFRNLKKLEFIELGFNNIQSLEPGIFHNQHKLKDLNLWGNNLQNLTKEAFEGASSILELDLSSNNIEELNEDVFEYLTNLSNINLSANRFVSLPAKLFEFNPNLSRIRLMDNRVPLNTLPSSFLSNLTYLEDIHIIRCDLEAIPDNLIHGSVNIRNLSLAGNKLNILPADLLVNQTNLLNLDLSHNYLNELNDELFVSAISLEVLKLSFNTISKISRNVFRNLRSLQELHLNNNALRIIHPEAFVTTGETLRNIQLQNNHLSFVNIDEDMMSFDDKTGSVFQYLKEIRTLNLRNNSIISILMDWNYNNYNLNELDLSYNNISYLSYTDINFFANDITVNLTHNAIQEINFREIIAQQNSLEREKHIKILLDYNPLRCDCVILHFIKFLRKEIGNMPPHTHIILDNMKCAEPAEMSGRYVKTIRPMELFCLLDPPKSEIKYCPKGCGCKVRTADRAMIVNCSNAHLTTVPLLPNPIKLGLDFTELFIENNNITILPSTTNHNGYNYVTEIYAKNNHIIDLQPENIPNNLSTLELANNQLKWVNSSVFDGFNKTRTLNRLLLGHNPWVCDCNAKDFLGYTQSHYRQIEDRKSIFCTDGRQFNELRIGDLCPEDEYVVIAVSIAVALLGLLIGILAALYYKYQQEVKVWMYAHKLCLWFVTEEELDKEKKYDAFISYSHKDVDFLTEHIVPYLENSPHQYKLCLHDRDWLVGAFIQESIARSVEDSRRTIVILSPNFLESIWAKMEFQVAHTNAISEGRARVIVVIYGDIGDIEKLDPALKSYLKTNTYVKWGDPWFWKKLSYAMPHAELYKSAKKTLIKHPIRSSVDDKLELIKPVPVTPPLTTPPAELASQIFHNGLNGHVNGAFIINTNAKQSDV